MKFKIAVVQFEISQYNPEENLKKAEEYIKQAAQAEAGIIVFPEDFVTGPIEAKKEMADDQHKYRKHFQNLAKKYGIDIIPGSVIEKEPSGLYNTTYYIDSTGKVKIIYQKVNLWLSERAHFIAGREAPVVKTKFGKIGLIICWDLMFPEIFRTMVKKGAEIIICPSYWCFEDAGHIVKHEPKSESILVDALSIGRAFENEIIFVYCNAAGYLELDREPYTLIGHSQVTVPFKGCIKKLDHNKEEIFIQEIDTGILKDAEKAYEIRKDLKCYKGGK